jgi:prevent-host-death family protein
LANLQIKHAGMKSVATNKAKTHLSALLQEVSQGETILITRGRKPLAKLVPYKEQISRPKVGEMMDDPVVVPEEALRSMNASELETWGLK